MPGRFHTNHTEYMRGVMDVFSDHKVSRVIGMFSAQVGKSTVIENVIAYHAHHDPSPIMVVEPTLEIAEAFSKDRLAPMIRDTPALKERFSPGRFEVEWRYVVA
ncbi:MAG: phage terminase large subunit family protein [Bryobacteraceae bacterium]